MKAASVLETIGHTPHIRFSRLFPQHEVWVKAERFNPGGSIKDRITETTTTISSSSRTSYASR